MLGWLKGLIGSEKKFAITSKGKVARIEKITNQQVLISFGSFDIENKWVIKKLTLVTIDTITKKINKAEAKASLKRIIEGSN